MVNTILAVWGRMTQRPVITRAGRLCPTTAWLGMTVDDREEVTEVL